MKSGFAFPRLWQELHRNCRQQYSPDTIPLLQAQIWPHKDVRQEQYSTVVSGITLYRLYHSLWEYPPGNQTADPTHPGRKDSGWICEGLLSGMVKASAFGLCRISVSCRADPDWPRSGIRWLEPAYLYFGSVAVSARQFSVFP